MAQTQYALWVSARGSGTSVTSGHGSHSRPQLTIPYRFIRRSRDSRRRRRGSSPGTRGLLGHRRMRVGFGRQLVKLGASFEREDSKVSDPPQSEGKSPS